MEKIRTKDGKRESMSTCLLPVHNGRWLSRSQTGIYAKPNYNSDDENLRQTFCGLIYNFVLIIPINFRFRGAQRTEQS